MTIPASTIANVIPSVLSPGGTGLVMNPLVLTRNPLMPTGSVLSFASASSVSDFFGPSSDEFNYAEIVFAGYVNSTQLPASILFAPYNETARAAWLTSGSLAAVTLTELQAITAGTLTITIAGTAETSSSINLSAATSFSDAATLIQDAFTSPAFSVAWNPVQSTFIFTSTATGATETIAFPTDTIATALYLTAATGATLSQGADADTPASAMNNIIAINQNWASVSYITEPTAAEKIGMAAWLSSQNGQYGGVIWDSNPLASVQGDQTSFGPIAKANNYNGVMAIGGDPAAGDLTVLCRNIAAFVQGMIASVNYAQTNGSITFAGKSAQSASVVPACLSLATYTNLLANGYSTYGAFASRNQGFTFLSNGNTPGKLPWANLYYDQMWLDAQLELALITLYTTIGKIPYDPYGYGLIRAALVGQNSTGVASDNGPINNALNNGVIQTNVRLSSSQAAEINAMAGVSNAASSVQNNGYFLQILDPGADARAAGQTPIINFWYANGGAVRQLTLASINVL